MGLLVQYSLVKKKLEGVDQHLKMTSKIRISRCSRRLLIILMSLTVTLFSEKKNYYVHTWNIELSLSNPL